MKKNKTIVFILTLSLLLNACTQETQNNEDNTAIKRWNEKTINQEDIYIPSKETPQITFTKTGTVKPEKSVNITTQIAGEIQAVHVSKNDLIQKNTPLITLGNSLNTEINEIQLATSTDALKIANSSLNKIEEITIKSLETAQISTQNAYENYKSSIQSKKTTMELYYLQIDELKNDIDKLKKEYEKAKKEYNKSKKRLDEAYENNDPAEIQSAKIGLETLKTAKENLKTSLEKAENGLEQFKLGNELQINQLNSAINASQTQYEIAQKQLESTKISAEQQVINMQAQISQTQSSKKIAETNKKYQQILAPVNGKITNVHYNEGNLVSPGQILITIENNDLYIVYTTINENEKNFIKTGNKVLIETQQGQIEGNIRTISDNINPQTQKIDVEIIAPNSNKIRSNELVTVHFTAKLKNALYIPINSVFPKNKETFAKTINNNGLIEYKKIETGKIIENYIEILEGLEENEKILKMVTTEINENDKIIIE